MSPILCFIYCLSNLTLGNKMRVKMLTNVQIKIYVSRAATRTKSLSPPRLAPLLLNCSASPQLNNETGTEPQPERVADDPSFMSDVDPSLSGGCLRSSSSSLVNNEAGRGDRSADRLASRRSCVSVCHRAAAAVVHTQGMSRIFYCSAAVHDSVRLSLYLSHGCGT